MGTEHKQVRIRCYGQDAYVDEGIAPLIKEMWRAGIETCMSCQEGAYGFVWLHFLFPDDAIRFLNIVAEYDPDPDSLYHRMLANDVDNPHSWKYKTLPEDVSRSFCDVGMDEVEVVHEGQPCVILTSSIWFPPSDLPAVMERLAGWKGDQA
jgi:hypothetical protein